MKHLRLLFLFVALLAAPLFADTPANDAVVKAQAALDAAKAVANPAPTLAPVISKGDEVLGFILKKAETYSDALEVGIGKAVDFAKEESPVLIGQWLKWRAYQAIWNIAFPALVAIVLSTVAILSVRTLRPKIKAYEESTDSYDDDPSVCRAFMWFGAVMMTVIPWFSTIVATYHNVPTLIQIHVAPHVYLVEEAMKLVHR